MKQPLSVTLISLLFIAAGAIGIIYHAGELKEIATDGNVIWVFVVRLLAIMGGVFALRGANWARWLLVVWIFGHVILSFFHTSAEVIMHAIIMAITIVALFNAKANKYF